MALDDLPLTLGDVLVALTVVLAAWSDAFVD